LGAESASVGLYIGPKRVYIAEVAKHRPHFLVTRTAEVEYANAATDLSQDIHNVLLLALQACFEKSGITKKNVELTLSGKEATTRYFEMPLIPKNEWPAAVGFEAQKYISFETKELRYAFEVIPNRAQKKMGVMFLAAKKDAAEKLLATISEAGAKAGSLESLSLSLVRAYTEILGKQTREAHLLVHIHEDGTTHLAVARDRLLLLTRDCHIAPGAEALEGVLDFDTLVTEIRLSFNYFNKNFKGEEVKRIVLFADTETAAKDWVERLRAEFGIVVESGMVAGYFGETKPLIPEMMLAVGAALRGFYPQDYKKLNLMVEEKAEAKPALQIAPEEEKKKLTARALQTAVLSVIALVFLHASLFFLTAQNSKRAALSKGSFASMLGLSPESATPLVLQQRQKLLTETSGFFASLVDRRPYLTDKLNELSLTIPDAVAIRSLTYTDELHQDGTSTLSMVLDGMVSMESASALSLPHRYAGILKQDALFMKGFKDIKINAVKKEEGAALAVAGFSLESVPSESQKEQSYVHAGEMAQFLPG
jgi:Tfp pilus assembly protein PilN